MALIYNATFAKNTRKLSFEDKAGNEIYSFTVPERTPMVDDITKPLTFRATQDGSTVRLSRMGYPSGSFQTSRDGGNTWSNYTIDRKITLNIGEEVSFRAKNDRTSAQGGDVVFYFEMAGKIEAWHNVMSLYRTNDFATYESVMDYAFDHLFWNCTSLTKAPALPATTLAIGCYSHMFFKCKSLTKAPALPATTLFNSCYMYMFSGCQSLTKAPELPATALANSCYRGMLKGCQSLTEAPVLPATTLADNCYGNMFYGCSSLNEVRCQMPSTISAEDIPTYTGTGANAWIDGVSSTGTFYTNADANWPSGVSGIPTGWRRVNEEAPTVDDPNKPLMLRAIEDGSSVTLEKKGTLSNTYQTSTNGTDWTDYTFGTKISLNKGESVYFRCSNHPTTQTGSNYVRFYMFGEIEAWHNAYSMISSSFTDTSASVGSYGMYILFYGCRVLTKAPLLLNALAEHCYDGMFSDCHALTQAPSLPATTLADGCYDGMFAGCSALKQAPSLPATTLADGCYDGMFYSCRALTQAPLLPATRLTNQCYQSMFAGCSNLKEVRISATTTTPGALTDWLKYVPATGDFYCDPNATIFPTDSTSGIPSGWTRHALADYPS